MLTCTHSRRAHCCRRLSSSHTTAKYIGFIGRLSSEKSVGLLLHAMVQVHAAYPLARLQVLGTGFLEPYLKEMCATLAISHVVDFVGFVEPWQLPTALEELDLVVRCVCCARRCCPTLVPLAHLRPYPCQPVATSHTRAMQAFPSMRTTSETFAIVNIEAMAMELPVVGFGVPGTYATAALCRLCRVCDGVAAVVSQARWTTSSIM